MRMLLRATKMGPALSRLFVGLGILFAANLALAQRNLTEIPEANPDLELQSFQVAEGFEVNLFAADPLLAKPIQASEPKP